MLRSSSAIVVLLAAPLVFGQNPATTLTVDANANRHAINPNVYGVAYGTTAQLSDLNVPLNRYGGNNSSRYNWLVNGDNKDNDWYFESIGDTSAVAGERGDTFISTTRAGGAQAMITVPMIPWIATLGANRSKLASFSIAKYGAQTGNDSQWFPDAGNGIWTNGAYVTGNNPADANVPNSSSLQGQWIQHIVNTWGLAQNGGQKIYILDNEHSIWFSTHRDVHPIGPTMSEIFSTMTDYAAEIKAVDPGVQIAGPEEWGWSGYFYSGYDQQWGNLNGWGGPLPDRTANGGMDYLPWLLTQLKADGRHLLDIFTVHYYPQGGEFSNDVTTATQLLRNQSTRSLWDPNYVDQSWINSQVMLIPRLRSWANTYYYPGTPIGITEYNWGAEPYINGATAQADIYGIFGQQGLDLATRWTVPASTTPTYLAMKMYRNYDGNKSPFGDTSVSAVAPNPDNVAVFAAQRTSDSALTVVVINKYLSGTTPITVSTANFTPAGTAQVYQLTSANAITRLTDLSVTGSTLSFTAPAQSITLLVLPVGTAHQPPVAMAQASPSSGIVPLSVQFTSTGSNDPDGTITSYSWNFGDGTNGSGATPPAHIYQTTGTFTAVLTVTDNFGATGTAQVPVTVNPNPNVVNPPTGLTGSGGKGKATLKWTNHATNATGIYIWRAPGGSTTFANIKSVAPNVTTYTDTLTRGNYVYKVQAYDATAVSAFSNSVTVSVK